MSALAGEKGNLVALGDVAGTFRSLQEAGLRLAIVSSDDRSAIDSAIDALSVGRCSRPSWRVTKGWTRSRHRRR